MSQAQKYNRKKNFTDNSGDRTDHAALDSELDAVSVSVNQLRANQSLLQRDDGGLADRLVGFDQLTDDAKEGLATPGPRGEKGDKGDQGVKGDQSPKGDVGASFVASQKGLYAQRANYDNEQTGYAFLSMDNGMLYFKLSPTAADWSNGYIFGKGDKGDKGDRGDQGIRGLTGLRGLKGDKGDKGDQGIQGQAGTVDYTRVVRNDQPGAQTIQGSLNLQSLNAAQAVTAQAFSLTQGITMQAVSGRIRASDGQTSPTLKGFHGKDFISSGTGAAETGYLIGTGADIGTLFDPAGTASGKLATVNTAPLVIDLTSKTTITLSLSVSGTEIVLTGSAT